MATWEKINRATESGNIVSMQAPIIVSASRSTDIPAFYADWFFHRLDSLHIYKTVIGNELFAATILDDNSNVVLNGKGEVINR